MRYSVEEAGARLDRLIEMAGQGEDVLLTRDGEVVARLVPALLPDLSARTELTPEQRRAVIDDIQRRAREKAIPGPDAARSQDFLYDEDGLPA